MATAEHVNVLPTASGRLRPVCPFCGKVGRAADPDPSGRPSLFAVVRDWCWSPYPPDFVHADGSTGDRWSCPACAARIHRGEIQPDWSDGSVLVPLPYSW